MGVILSSSKGDVGKGLYAPWFDPAHHDTLRALSKNIKSTGFVILSPLKHGAVAGIACIWSEPGPKNHGFVKESPGTFNFSLITIFDCPKLKL